MHPLTHSTTYVVNQVLEQRLKVQLCNGWSGGLTMRLINGTTHK